MSECVTTGTWIVDDNNREAFVAAWSTFAAWSCDQPGARELRLGHDNNDHQRHVSFGVWDSAEAVQAWKTSPEFRDHLAHVLQYVGEFQSTDLEVNAACATARPIGVHR